MSNEQNRDKRFWLGLFLVIIGGVWLMDNLDIIPYYWSHYIFNWWNFLILLGLYFIVGRKKPEVGLILVLIGGVFLARDLHFFSLRHVWHLFWPAVIIIIGAVLILRRGSSGWLDGDSDSKKNDDSIDDFAIFGGRERTITSQNFKNGKITAMFGGSEIDMRNADLAEGENELDLFVAFGGTDVIVPPDWTVKIEVFSLFGGFSDNRTSPVKVVPNPDKVLRVKGFVMFGGGAIKLNK